MSGQAQKLLGIDLGTRFIGLAIGDSGLRIATGLDVLEFKGTPEFLEIIRGIIKEYEIDFVVLGLPLNMDGSEGNKAKEAREFAEKIRGLNVKVELIDEGLTTDQAIRELHAGDGKVGKQREKINMIAAAIILQNYLDNLPPDIL